jgi:hypothetical protein
MRRHHRRTYRSTQLHCGAGQAIDATGEKIYVSFYIHMGELGGQSWRKALSGRPVITQRHALAT